MSTILDDISRTFREFLIVPGLTGKEHVPANVSLKAPLTRYSRDKGPTLQLNIPVVSAAMQSVSGSALAIALARKGGCSFIFCSQSIDAQVGMVKQVKDHKAGFVASDSNLAPTATLQDAVSLRRKTGHSARQHWPDTGPLFAEITEIYTRISFQCIFCSVRLTQPLKADFNFGKCYETHRV